MSSEQVNLWPATMFRPTPKYLMVFDHDITLESLATILLHLTLWRGPMRRQSDFFLHLSSCLADEVLFHTQPILIGFGVRKPRELIINLSNSKWFVGLEFHHLGFLIYGRLRSQKHTFRACAFRRYYWLCVGYRKNRRFSSGSAKIRKLRNFSRRYSAIHTLPTR